MARGRSGVGGGGPTFSEHLSKKVLIWFGVGINVYAHDDHTQQAPHVRGATPACARCVADPGSELGSFRR